MDENQKNPLRILFHSGFFIFENQRPVLYKTAPALFIGNSMGISTYRPCRRQQALREQPERAPSCRQPGSRWSVP